jgi:hypothetical protein
MQGRLRKRIEQAKIQKVSENTVEKFAPKKEFAIQEIKICLQENMLLYSPSC